MPIPFKEIITGIITIGGLIGGGAKSEKDKVLKELQDLRKDRKRDKITEEEYQQRRTEILDEAAKLRILTAAETTSLEHDIQLEPYEVMPVILSDGQVADWGHVYLEAANYYTNTRGSGAVVFVIDTAGTFSDHPDLVGNCLPHLNRNITNSPARDAYGHGTHCAGIVAATDNGIGVIGIAPEAKLVALKALDDSGGGSYAWIADQIRYAADLPATAVDGRQKIISMSLGGPAGVPCPSILRDAIDYAIEKDCIVVAAAGNSGYTGRGSTVGAPGNYDPVITVASTDRPGSSRSSFSSGGREVDIAGPGGDIYSTHHSGGYAKLSGTSMACPQIAGVLALLVSSFPRELDMTAQDWAVKMLVDVATDILSPGTDHESGAGIPRLGKVVPPSWPVDPEPAPAPVDPEPIPEGWRPAIIRVTLVDDEVITEIKPLK